MRRVVSALFVAAIAMAVAVPAFAQKDVHLGTWKLNQAKSKPANPNAKPQQVPAILHITAVPNGHHFVSDYVDGDGRKVHTEYTVTYDGKPAERTITTDGKPVKSTISIRRIDDYTLEHTFKSAAGQTSTQMSVVSKDGRTRTNTITGTNPQGQKVVNITVYDRQ